ncbi:MAG: DUF1566 domain-containing protein [Bacteroidales bacterium]|nr:DUF1566 domain-containing protein [Bacteroidales bacterium]
MKRIILVLASLLISVLSFTQAPESFNYQAIVRDAAGQEITDQLVGIQISLLQTTAVGTAVYVERFTPTTNNFGLITLDIGTGDVQSGVFADIDWSAGPYFLKVEMDENGLTDYVEIGTSQLLSVPYSLYSNAVANELQDLSDVLSLGNDAGNTEILNVSIIGIGTNSPHESTALEIQSTTKGFLPPGMTHFQRDMIVSPEAGLQIYNTTTKKPNYFNGAEWLNFDGTVATLIGENYAGGIVFYVDGTGQHGLVCTETDLSSAAAQWGCIGILTGADGLEIGTGYQNTLDIELGCTTSGIAADLCANLELNDFEDWFLPSLNELLQMNLSLQVNGFHDFGGNRFWSSSETDSDNAWSVFLHNGTHYILPKDYSTGSVRAIRAF